jgi:Leucine-rich repeat (LRR) protein
MESNCDYCKECVGRLVQDVCEVAPDYSGIREELGGSIIPGALDDGGEKQSTYFCKLCQELERSKRCTTYVEDGSGLTRIDTLNMNLWSLVHLPGSLGERLDGVGLRQLHLSGNALRDLPASIRELGGSLKELFLDNNLFTKIPEVVFDLPALKHLDISKNSLQGVLLHGWEGKKKQGHDLEWLDISSNTKLVGLDGNLFLLFPRMTRLDAHSCSIQHLPDELGMGLDLEHVSLHSNCLEYLPESIGKCTKMQWLSLNSNKLKCLPDSMGCMQGLVRLSCHINELETIPESLCLNCVHLEAFSLHSNNLHSIPDAIGNLKECVRLSLYHNPMLGCIPDGVFFMTKLRELWVYDCGVTRVDGRIKNLVHLQKLWLDRNPLEELDWDGLAHLNLLQELYVDQTPLAENGDELRKRLSDLKMMKL